ncbi:MAG: RDD family protein [Rhodoplanes sp.]|uniref:RDD family protein n=1 Tax=Rhodoplanes sp. TaxID=1968906 RepID=UPI0017C38C95|nr:RDD family protein [Rhodoplanes sp.]NVO16787.1 RDD family protein [Rhodoplanes sp.]
MSVSDPAKAPVGNASAAPASLWRRLIAFTLDTTLLGAIGYSVGMMLFDLVVDLGLGARLIGLALALAYFGLSDSRLTKGRSFGKRLLGIAVVGPDGAPLSIGTATLRALVVMAPIILNDFDLDDISPIVTGLWSFLVIGVGASLLYLLLFNRTTRQSLHDLMVGSMVISVGTPRPAAHPLWIGHRIVVGVLCAVSLAFGLLIPSMVQSSGRLSELLVVRTALMTRPGLRDVGVSRVWSTETGRPTKDSIVVTAYVRRWPADPEAEARDIAGQVLKEFPDLVGTRTLVVKVALTFNLGIANYSKQQQIETSAAAWPKIETRGT